MDFSLLFFAARGYEIGDAYRLLMDATRFADEHGLSGIWTPERHFRDFGGPYPNPSVIGAALAAVTHRIGIRAGSVVLPLHHPARIVEEWAVVDNISGGRVGISFASGWHIEDFIFAPDKFERRRQIIAEGVSTVRSLWRGEKVAFDGVGGKRCEISTLPRPVQPELPVWITSGGSPETALLAANMGANLLTHVMEQGFDGLAKNIEAYRTEFSRVYDQPGYVTVMLHAFLRPDGTARDLARAPLTAYLSHSLQLELRNASIRESDMSTDIEESDQRTLIDRAVGRHLERGLIGTPEEAHDIIAVLNSIGVDEVACLIDFGVEYGDVMKSLESIAIVASEWI
jgi:natural product biosynthesis luciferase-like monooxygenase protein